MGLLYILDNAGKRKDNSVYITDRIRMNDNIEIVSVFNKKSPEPSCSDEQVFNKAKKRESDRFGNNVIDIFVER